ncbi:hypothetical protein PVAR5_1842 [Paecilomyces variotii No. 5]|uniref:Uncharacterized protein n=1 Tax=Byssochlamys spectabilis (strain No. 5 / NBRC 109023) TaxID=1356009 RepID=V5HUE9_BYSSN|nr:hypothetical protein PVAR5_1842 [Paecilomyces variotii No. 5]
MKPWEDNATADGRRCAFRAAENGLASTTFCDASRRFLEGHATCATRAPLQPTVPLLDMTRTEALVYLRRAQVKVPSASPSGARSPGLVPRCAMASRMARWSPFDLLYLKRHLEGSLGP